MAQIRPSNPDGPEGHEGSEGPGEPSAVRPRRRGLRYGVPVAVAGVAAVTVGLVPALASAGQPDLPKITAKQLVAKMAASDVQQMSGTVKLSTDLGLPEMPGMGGGGGGQGGGSPFGGPHGSGGDHGSGDGAGADGGKAAADPQSKLMSLASGEHKLRVAADGPEKQRVSLVEEASEYSLIHNAGEVWGYDSGSDSAYHAEAPEAGKDHKGGGSGKDHQGAPGPEFGKGLQDATPQEAAAQALKTVDDSTSVSVDGTAKIAGRDAYQLVIEPKGAPHSTVESVRIGVDAENGTPLKFTLTPKEGGKAAIDAAYTDVDFQKPAAKTFDFEPPKGTDVTEAKPGEHKSGEHKSGERKPGSAPGSRPGDKDGKDGKDGKSGAEPRGEHAKSGTKVLGEGWDSIAVIKNGKGMPGSPVAGSGSGGGPATLEAGPGQQDGKSEQGEQMLDGFTEKAEGDFGTGRIVSTRLVNALMTDDGTVYVGAVTKEGLIKAADAAAG